MMNRELSPSARRPSPEAHGARWLRAGMAVAIALLLALTAVGGHAAAQGSGEAESQEAPGQRMARALLRAVAEGHPGKVEAALEAGADPNVLSALEQAR